MLEAECTKADSSAPHTPYQGWHNGGDVVDGPMPDEDTAVHLHNGGQFQDEEQDPAALGTELDAIARHSAPRAPYGNTPSNGWSARTTYYPAYGNPDATSYISYGEPPYTPWADDTSSDYPTTASGSETLQDDQAQAPQHAGHVYDYTLGRWVYEDVNLQVPVRYSD